MYVPTLGVNSAYSLEKAEVPANNTIEIPTYNSDTGLVEAINYELGINKTTFGLGENSRNYTYEVVPNYDVTFTAQYNTADLQSRVTVRLQDKSDVNYSGAWVDLHNPPRYGNYHMGGAMTNYFGQMGSISGLFVGNTSPSSTHQAWGGAIIQRGSDPLPSGYVIEYISADFIANSAVSTKTEASGGAVALALCTIKRLEGNFIGNHSEGMISGGYGGALYTVNRTKLELLKGNFIANYATSPSVAAFGGAVTADFLGNHADGTTSAKGGAIGYYGGTSKSVVGDFINNYAISKEAEASGGAIYSYYGETGDFKSNFINNYVKAVQSEARGGAIASEYSEWGTISGDFIGNYAISETGVAQGGAIWTDGDLNFVADNEDMIFAGNYTISNGKKDDNAIYVGSADATLSFELKNGANLILKDNIDGLTGYGVNIDSDGSSTYYMLNDLRGADLSIANLNINPLDNVAHEYKLNSLSLSGNSTFVADVDFTNNTMDRFVTNNTYSMVQGANLNVSNLNLLNLPTKEVVEILFAEEGLKDNVSYSGITSLTTPLYTYDVSYQNKQDGGYFVFAGGSALGEGKGFNPTVLSSSVNSTVGALGTMNQTFTYSFQNSDNYMNIPYAERLAYKNRNRYAISPMSNGRFSPLFTHDEVGSVWVKPYATFESVNLDNGPKVSNISYGTLIGFDTGIESIGKGWDRAFTGFIGYNGASQRYRGVDSIQNGGMLGGTMTLYKNNFFNATTVSVGASVANNQTMFGNEDYAMLLSGIANKTGYNFEFKEGKFIIQPSMLLSYTFVNTFDYTNAAGVRMQNDPFHSLQISPGVKFIGNFKGGWQPYLGVNMVWNIMGETDAYANGVKLPQMSVKPYVQYGVGVQKRMKDHFMAYGQAMVQNGGRNGLALTCGIRWSIGCKSCQKHQKVEGVKEKTQITAQTTTVSETGKKIIKQMTPQQRYAMGAKPYNPSRTATTSSTIIKYSK